MAGKSLVYHVTVADEKGEQHTFGPNDTVPAWAAKAITNPGAWADGSDAPADDEGSTGGDSGSGQANENPYKGLLKADLEAEVEKRNADREDDDKIVVGGNGTVADLKAALEADDADQA